MIARAPGKLVLSGAYAVLEGAPALVTAVDRYATADSSRQAALLTEEVAAAIRAGDLERAPWFDAAPLRVPLADGTSRKLGLGSSAAILVASLGAAHAASPDDGGCWLEWVFPRALAAHRAAQGGGSGIDVAASTFGGVLRVRLEGAEPVIETHALPEVNVAVFAAREPASTKELVGRVRRLAGTDPVAHARLFGALREASEAASTATRAEELVRALDAQFVTLRDLGLAAGAPIVPDELLALAERARTEGAAFGPSGAGGGDVAIFVGSVPSAAFCELAERAALEPLDMSLGARGLHVEG